MASPLDDSSHFSNEELREKLNERGWSITKSYFMLLAKKYRANRIVPSILRCKIFPISNFCTCEIKGKIRFPKSFQSSHLGFKP